MQDQERLSPVERELESALAGLRPAGASLERDRLMYLAGRASTGRGRRFWPTLTVMLAAALGVSLAFRPAPRQVERVVYRTIERPAQPEAPSTFDLAYLEPGRWSVRTGYLSLREKVLEKGLGALPEPAGGQAGENQAETLGESLGLPKRAHLTPEGIWGLGKLIFGEKS